MILLRFSENPLNTIALIFQIIFNHQNIGPDYLSMIIWFPFIGENSSTAWPQWEIRVKKGEGFSMIQKIS